MNANVLIPIEPRRIGKTSVQAVNGRDLHAYLQVPTKFKDWLPRRIREFRFDEGSDFGSFLSRSANNRQTREYALSLGMAKILAMLERSDRGEEARRFFMECEHASPPAALPEPVLGTFEVSTEVATGNTKKDEAIDALASKLADAVVAKLAPRALPLDAPPPPVPAPDASMVRKAEAFDHLTAKRGDACSMREAAKQLGIQPMQFNDWLNALKWIFRGANGWEAYQHRIEAGHLEHRLNVIDHGNGLERAHAQVRVTVRGLAKLAEILREDANAPPIGAKKPDRLRHRTRKQRNPMTV